MRAIWGWCFGLSFGLLSALPSFGIDVVVPQGFQHSATAANVGGGVAYLNDGDILAFSSDYVNGPALSRVDVNGDGFPAGGAQSLIQFDPSTFPAFVQVAPSGKFALFGVTGGDSSVYRVDIESGVIVPLFLAPGNFDLAFVDDTHAYLSSNPGGFDPSVPNIIDFIDLSGVPVVRRVAEISNSPSGPVVVNEGGDLYYVRGTFLYPPPPSSSALLKFSAGALASALTSGVPLTEGDASAVVPLDGGYDLVFRRGSSGGELFLSTIGEKIFRVDEGSLTPTVFASFSDPTFPAATFLSLYRPAGGFDPESLSQTILGVAVATQFFSDFSFVQIYPETLDTDGDGVPNTSDRCIRDERKSSPGVCGCGVPELDSNRDQIVDCGTARTFSTALRPKIGAVVVSTKRNAKFVFEKVAQSGAEYQIEIRGPGKKVKRYRSKSNVLKLSKLAKGSYTITFKIVRRSNRSEVRSRTSGAFRFNVR